MRYPVIYIYLFKCSRVQAGRGGPGKNQKMKENAEDCAAGRCVTLGANVGWVQCETCQLWFHYLCVVTQDELDQIAAYACKNN